MKKQHRPKLHVNVETVRALAGMQLEQLKQVGGGGYATTLMAHTGCECGSNSC